MTRRQSIFNESKDKFVKRHQRGRLREILHEVPLLSTPKEDTIGELGLRIDEVDFNSI